MNFKKVNKYVTDDDETFSTKKAAQNHCDRDALSKEFKDTWLDSFIDFDELMLEYESVDFDDAISILNKIIEFKTR